jgi:hypothetical protein
VKTGRKPKYKRCPDCWRKKLIAEDFYTWLDRGRPRVSTRCKLCHRKRVRARYAAMMADPYLAARERDRKNSWEQVRQRQIHNAERCRRYRERLKTERPEVYRQQLEDARIRNRRRHERRNRPITTKRAAVINAPPVKLPSEPLKAFLAHVDLDAERPNLSVAAKRAAFRVLHEGNGIVTATVADLVITSLGGSLTHVYPELYA